MKQIYYTWRHLYNSSSAKIAKFRRMERCEVPQSDWVSGTAWGSPVAIFIDEVCYE
tara:strand:- start:1737 stop:1904 length:168 start_codon:yes stop_codon:yes gene_type:complete